MSDRNNFTDVISDSKKDANKTSGDGNGSNELEESSDDVMMMMNSSYTDVNKNSTTQIMRTIDEEKPSQFDSLTDGEIMYIMNEYPEGVEKEAANDFIGNGDDDDNFLGSYPEDTEMMDSHPNGDSAHHDHSNNSSNEADFGIDAAASQTNDPNYDHGSFFGDDHAGLQTNASSVGEDTSPSWLRAVKDAAVSKTSDDEERRPTGKSAQNEGAQEFNEEKQQQQAVVSSESTQMMQEISAKLDEKLNDTRLLTKRLLQEISIFVESMEAVNKEYARIRESELHESQRLDAVEPEVNNASGMLLAGGAGGHFLGGASNTHTDTGAQEPPARSPPSVALAHELPSYRRRHSSSKLEVRPKRAHRDRPLTPIVDNRQRSVMGRDGKENYASLRRSIA